MRWIATSYFPSLGLALFLLLPGNLQAQSISWRPTNGPYGASVNALITAANGSVFAGTARGLYRSDDECTTWALSAFAGKNIRVLARDSSRRLYAGTGGGLFRSTDHGDSWSLLGFADSTVSDFAIQTNGLYFVAASVDTGTGLFRSSDEGATWVQLEASIPDPEEWASGYPAHAFKVDAVADSVLYAYDGSVLRSTDNGGTWCVVYVRAVLAGIRSWVQGVGNVQDIVALADGHAVLVANESNLFRIEECHSNCCDPIILYDWVNTLHRMPDGTILAGTRNHGLLRTTDNGDSWTEFGPESQTIRAIDVTPDGSIDAGSDIHGVHRTTDDGMNWRTSAEGMFLTRPQRLFAGREGTMFIQTESELFGTTNGGVTWERAGLDRQSVRALIVDDAGNLLAGTNGFGELVRSTDDGRSWERIAVAKSKGVKSIAAGNGVIAVSLQGEVLAVGGPPYFQEYLGPPRSFVSTDNGATWRKTLERVDVYAIVFGRDGVLFAWAKGLLRSTDNGATWHALTTTPDTVATRLFALSDGSVYARFQGNTLWQSQDNGDTWQPLGSELPGVPGAVVRNREGTFYTIADGRLFRLADVQVPWQEIDDAPPGPFLGIDSDGYLYSAAEYRPVFRSAGPTVSVNETDKRESFELHAVSSDPVSGCTIIRYSLERRARVRLSLIDVLGREVKTLYEGEKEQGEHRMEVNAGGLASGTYVVRLLTEDRSATESIVVRR